MNRKECIQAGIDYDQGVNRFMGNTALYEKFALKFTEDETFAKLQEALQSGDIEQSFNMAHTLKGVTGNLSFNALFKKIIPVVEALRNQDIVQAKLLFPSVEAEYSQLMAMLKEQH